MQILVIQLKRIGDTILTTPALRALREAYPQASITLLLAENCRDLIPALTMVDHIFVYQHNRLNLTFWKMLIFKRLDLCFDFSGTDRSIFISQLSRAKQRIGFSWAIKSILKRQAYTDIVSSDVRQRHTVDHYLDLIEYHTKHTGNKDITIDIPNLFKEKSIQLREKFSIRVPYILLQPGAAREEKYWKSEYWATIADYCARTYNLQIALTGSTNAYEQRHLEKIKEIMTCEHTDLSGQTDLLTLMALIGEARLLLCVDSAAMHFGAATKTPLIALFGITNPYHWYPRTSHAKILMAGDDKDILTPHHRKAPMYKLLPERVQKAIDQLLDKTAQ